VIGSLLKKKEKKREGDRWLFYQQGKKEEGSGPLPSRNSPPAWPARKKEKKRKGERS